MIFDEQPISREPIRDSSPDEASRLPAGAAHYRAFVGPPDRYDFMSATQFSLLFALGLRESHRVLDFGCGSLRLGRLLIPFLREDCYFAIEPNRWLVDDAIAKELGADILSIKRPRFSWRNDFDCSDFGTTFDYVVAQSIITHAGPDIAMRLLRNFRAVMSPNGLCLFTYRSATEMWPAQHPDGWTYPEVVFYEHVEIERFVNDAGLVGTRLPWYHPKATWFAATLRQERLPAVEHYDLLRGAVVGDQQFADSCR
jgi:SAM-dependent methyltransferase